MPNTRPSTKEKTEISKEENERLIRWKVKEKERRERLKNLHNYNRERICSDRTELTSNNRIKVDVDKFRNSLQNLSKVSVENSKISDKTHTDESEESDNIFSSTPHKVVDSFDNFIEELSNFVGDYENRVSEMGEEMKAQLDLLVKQCMDTSNTVKEMAEKNKQQEEKYEKLLKLLDKNVEEKKGKVNKRSKKVKNDENEVNEYDPRDDSDKDIERAIKSGKLSKMQKALNKQQPCGSKDIQNNMSSEEEESSSDESNESNEEDDENERRNDDDENDKKKKKKKKKIIINSSSSSSSDEGKKKQKSFRETRTLADIHKMLLLQRKPDRRNCATFLAEVSNVVNIYKKYEKEIIKFAAVRTQNALIISKKDELKKFSEFKKMLLESFTTVEECSTIRTRIAHLLQGNTEKLNNYIERTLMLHREFLPLVEMEERRKRGHSKASVKETLKNEEKYIIRQFIQGLMSLPIRMRMLSMSFETLESATNQARCASILELEYKRMKEFNVYRKQETNKNRNNFQKGKSRLGYNRNGNYRNSNNTNSSNNHSNENETKNAENHLQAQTNKCKVHANATHTNEQCRSQVKADPNACFICKKIGHKKAECPNRKAKVTLIENQKNSEAPGKIPEMKQSNILRAYQT